MKITLPSELVEVVIGHCERFPMNDQDVIDSVVQMFEARADEHAQMQEEIDDRGTVIDDLQAKIDDLEKSVDTLSSRLEGTTPSGRSFGELRNDLLALIERYAEPAANNEPEDLVVDLDTSIEPEGPGEG